MPVNGSVVEPSNWFLTWAARLREMATQCSATIMMRLLYPHVLVLNRLRCRRGRGRAGVR